MPLPIPLEAQRRMADSLIRQGWIVIPPERYVTRLNQFYTKAKPADAVVALVDPDVDESPVEEPTPRKSRAGQPKPERDPNVQYMSQCYRILTVLAEERKERSSTKKRRGAAEIIDMTAREWGHLKPPNTARFTELYNWGYLDRKKNTSRNSFEYRITREGLELLDEINKVGETA